MNKNEQGKGGGGGGVLACVYVHFLKKPWDFQNEVLKLFSIFSYWLLKNEQEQTRVEEGGGGGGGQNSRILSKCTFWMSS